MQGPTVDNARTVTIAPGVTCYMKDLTVESTGKLIAKGTKALRSILLERMAIMQIISI